MREFSSWIVKIEKSVESPPAPAPVQSVGAVLRAAESAMLEG